MTEEHLTRDTKKPLEDGAEATPGPSPADSTTTDTTPTTSSPASSAPAQPPAPRGKVESEPSEEMLEKIELVAQLKAEGGTWAQIGARLEYASGDSCRKSITGNYPTPWAAAWTHAREELRPQYEAEAVATLRELMQPVKTVWGINGKPCMLEDGVPKMEERKEQVRESAAHALLQHVSRMQAQEISLRMKGSLGHHDTRLDELEEEDLDEIIAAAVGARAARQGTTEGTD